MKFLFAALSLTASLVWAAPSQEVKSNTVAETQREADSNSTPQLWKKIRLAQVQPFCAGSCQRDFDCASGCSCAMNGSCH